MGNSNTREALNDKEYDGQDFQAPSELRDGPMTNRKCTDLLFVLLFIVTLGGYGWTVKYSFDNGNPNKLLRPVNGDGKLCGVGELVDYPKLYYIMNSAEKPMTPRAVCVDFCP